MDTEPALQQAYDDVLKKIGRNLLMFQKAELLLKELLRLGGFEFKWKIGAPFEESVNRYATMTLGGLTTAFLDRHCSGKEPEFPEPAEDPTEIRFTRSVMIVYDDDLVLEKRKQSLEQLKNERNQFVHQLLPEFDCDDIDSCIKTAEKLDLQRERVLPEIKALHNDYKSFSEALSQLFDFDTGRGFIESHDLDALRSHPVVVKLWDIAGNSAGEDGWLPLGRAVKSTDFSNPQIAEACRDFGKSNLTELLVATGIFDLKIEKVTPDRNRVFYQRKSGIPLDWHPNAAV